MCTGSTVESGHLAHALIGITAKFYTPHSQVQQIAGVYGGKGDHALKSSHLYLVIAAKMMASVAACC